MTRQKQIAKREGVGTGMVWWSVAAGILSLATFYLFANLGTYSLWDDEAETALGARGILKTGDTTAVLDHNLNARRAGINLKNLHDRLTPPLGSYMVATSFWVGRQDAWFARLPFALCGLASVLVMLSAFHSNKLPLRYLVLFGVALLCQVSFFLFFRQARYYGSSLFLSVAIIYLYLEGWNRAGVRVLIGLLTGFLFLSHPLISVQVVAVLASDWLLFRRKESPFEARWIFDLGLPALILIIPSLFVWNPFLTKSKEYLHEVSWADRLTLFGWNFRDLFTAEFMPLALLLLAPVAYLASRDRWILRVSFALLVIILITSLFSYQRVQVTNVADVRYLVVALPLGLALSWLTLGPLFARTTWGWILIILILGTNLGTGKIFTEQRLSSTPLRWMRELIIPVEEPYRPVIDWIRKHVPPGASIWVEPDYMMYPLMFHAPQSVYAWQLEDDSDPQWVGLNPLHFRGRIAPDFIIAFGPYLQQIVPKIQSMHDSGINYRMSATINRFWKELYRPEIFWRSFRSVQTTGQPYENIYIFEKQKSN